MRRQQQLAELVGVHQSTISNIESGRELSAAYLYAIAEALRVSPDEIMLGTGEEDMSSLEIQRIYKSMTSEQRENLLNVARALAPKANSKAA